MTVLHVLSVLAIIQGFITLIDGMRAARYARKKPAVIDRRYKVAVFCPCKGIDHDFEKNIRSILDQDYSDYTTYFIVESIDDPAYGSLRQIGASHILVAGAATDCGQKVHNLRYAVQHVGDAADTYAFCDSDARYPRQWLRALTSPLEDSQVGVTTGFRWYIPGKFHFSTLLRSAWNAAAVGLLGDHDRNFAWGGSMALRRETFERIDVSGAWRGAVSDDYAVTRAVQRSGLKIHFVSSCLIPSYGTCGFRELLEFTTRQIIITRVYHPRLWGIAFAAQTLFNATFVWLMLRLFSDFTAAVLWITIYTLSGVRSSIRLGAVRNVLDDPSLWRFAWFYILSSPAVAFLYQYNMIVSTLTSDIQWRHIHYRLISPNQTRVRRSSVSAS